MAEIDWDQLAKDWLKFRQEFYMQEQNCGLSGTCPAQEEQQQSHAGHVEFKCASWIRPLVDPAKRRQAVARTRVRLSELPEFDAIAFTGLSGSVIAGAVASAMDKYLYCVRKEGESKHSAYVVEGPETGLRYIIIDDFISSGSTVRRVMEKVAAHTDNQAKCVGAYLWRDDDVMNEQSISQFAG